MSLTLDVGQDPNTVLVGHPNFALAGVTVRMIRDLGFGVKRVPLPDDPNHVEVTGNAPRSNSLKKKRSKLAKSAFWVIDPPNH